MEHDEDWDENRQGLFHSLGSMNSISGGVPGGRDSVSSQMFESNGYNIDSALPSDSDHTYDHHSSEEVRLISIDMNALFHPEMFACTCQKYAASHIMLIFALNVY